MRNRLRISQPWRVSAFMRAVGLLALGVGGAPWVLGQTAKPASVEYHIYGGSSDGAPGFTWSHGDQWAKPKEEVGKAKKPGIFVSPEGAQFPAEFMVLKPDWKKAPGV